MIDQTHLRYYLRHLIRYRMKDISDCTFVKSDDLLRLALDSFACDCQIRLDTIADIVAHKGKHNKVHTVFSYFDLDTLIAFSNFIEFAIARIKATTTDRIYSESVIVSALEYSKQALIRNSGTAATAFSDMYADLGVMTDENGDFAPEKIMSESDYADKYDDAKIGLLLEVYLYPDKLYLLSEDRTLKSRVPDLSKLFRRKNQLNARNKMAKMFDKKYRTESTIKPQSQQTPHDADGQENKELSAPLIDFSARKMVNYSGLIFRINDEYLYSSSPGKVPDIRYLVAESGSGIIIVGTFYRDRDVEYVGDLYNVFGHLALTRSQSGVQVRINKHNKPLPRQPESSDEAIKG